MLKYMRKVFIVAAMAFLAMGAQAQNLVKNGNFDTPLNNEKTYATIPSTPSGTNFLASFWKYLSLEPFSIAPIDPIPLYVL